MKQFSHPELQNGEVLFTNADSEQFGEMDWNTKREGFVAYDGEGNKLGYKDWSPVFIKQAELDNKKIDIQDVRKQWRETRE